MTMKAIRVGVHVSIAGSLMSAFDRARERGCDCFQIFLKNPRGWNAKPISGEEGSLFQEAVQDFSPGPVFAHISYLPNLAGEKEELYERSVGALITELDRCDILGIPYLVTHLGHAGDSVSKGVSRVVQAVQTALSEAEGTTMLLLENTAGEKHSVGSHIEDIARVFDECSSTGRVGICFDTCHAFAAGYDLRDEQSVGAFAGSVDDLIGLDALRLIHLNDAKGDLKGGLDRHEHIGLGSLGEKGVRAILHHSVLRDIPFICETPVDNRRGDRENLQKVRELSHETD